MLRIQGKGVGNVLMSMAARVTPDYAFIPIQGVPRLLPRKYRDFGTGQLTLPALNDKRYVFSRSQSACVVNICINIYFDSPTASHYKLLGVPYSLFIQRQFQ
jgi:hypothetical protein